jgi:hypothetical protein
VDSVAVAVAQAESAIAGKRLGLIEQAKGCHESMAPFFFVQSPHSAICHRLGAVYPLESHLLLASCLHSMMGSAI